MAQAKACWKAILTCCPRNWVQKDRDKWFFEHLSWKRWALSLMKQSISRPNVSCTSMAIGIKWPQHPWKHTPPTRHKLQYISSKTRSYIAQTLVKLYALIIFSNQLLACCISCDLLCTWKQMKILSNTRHLCHTYQIISIN
jgi:hypothetical protein